MHRQREIARVGAIACLGGILALLPRAPASADYIEGVCVLGCPAPAPSAPPTPTGPTPQQLQQMKEEQERQRIGNLTYYNNLGIKAYNEGRYQEAVDYFEQAIKFSPFNPTIQNSINIARQKADAALREAESARFHGQSAQGMAAEPASEEARRVFDRTGKPQPTTTGAGGAVVDARGTSQRYQVPAAYANKPEIQAMERERQALERKYATLNKQLDDLERKAAVTTDPAKRGDLQMKKYDAKRQLSAIPAKIHAVEDKMKDQVNSYVIRRKSGTENN